MHADPATGAGDGRVSLAPIALFVYNRPAHTRRTLEHLARCAGFSASRLVVFCDGPKSSGDTDAVHAARRVVHELAAAAEIVEATANRGLAASIIGGVGRLVGESGRVIVVEDDLIVHPAFLEFLNAGLDRFADAERVMQVSGHLVPVPSFANRRDALFLPFTTTWGWATWERAWQHFNPDVSGSVVLDRDGAMRRRFNLDESYDYAFMMALQRAGAIDAWGPRWYWSVFACNGLVLFPPQSLVQNAGMDGSGTNGWISRLFHASEVSPAAGAVVPELPASVAVNPVDLAAVCQAVARQSGGPLRHLLDAMRRLRYRSVLSSKSAGS